MGSIAEPKRRSRVLGAAALLLALAAGSARAAQPVLEKAESELQETVERWKPHVVRVTTVQQVKTLELRNWESRKEDAEVRRIFRRSEDVPGLIVDPDGYVLTSAEALAGAHHVVVTLADERYFRARFVGLDAARGVGLVDIGPIAVDHFSWKPVRDLQIGSFAVSLSASEKDAPVRLDLCFVSSRVTEKGSEHDVASLEIAGSSEIRRGATISDLRGQLVGMVVAPTGRSWPVPRGVGSSSDETEEASALRALEKSLLILTRSGSMTSWRVLPAPLIRRTLDDLLAGDEERGVRREPEDGAGWLGMKIAPSVPDELETALGGRPGAYILAVCENGPAKAAGLRPGDVVLRYGGEPVGDGRQLGSLILASKPGEQMEMTLLRDGEEIEMPVSVGVF